MAASCPESSQKKAEVLSSADIFKRHADYVFKDLDYGEFMESSGEQMKHLPLAWRLFWLVSLIGVVSVVSCVTSLELLVQ